MPRPIKLIDMAISIYYRKTLNPNELPFAKSDVVLDRPLTMLEIDANMKAIDLAFDKSAEDLGNLEAVVDDKAPIRNPILKGIVGIPQYANAGLLPRQIVGKDGAPLIAPIGSIAFDTENRNLMLLVQNDTQGTKWSAINTTETMSGYVRKTGDIMTGNLEGTSASWTQHIFALPPDKTVGEPKDMVATVEWSKSTITQMIDDRLSGGDSDTGTNNIIINKGDLIINSGGIKVDGDINITGTISASKLQGNLDCGVL